MAGSRENKTRDFEDAITGAAWHRLRSLALATARYENIVPLKQALDAGSDTASSRETASHDESDKIALSFLLLALQDVFDLQNYSLMRAMADGQAGHAIDDLADVANQPQLAVRERLSALVQAGFVQKTFDPESFFLTSEGAKIVESIDSAIEKLAVTIENELPKIFGE